MEKIKHLDLFSGIGGFALAIEMVFGRNNVEHIFCDNEPFSQAILKKHWPNASVFSDIRGLTADTFSNQHRTISDEIRKTQGLSRVSGEALDTRWVGGTDILTGGFPCQPFSQAGRRRGTEDDRYLWPEMLRVIREFNPRWVVGENVGGLVTWSNGLVLEQVCADLEAEGYEVQPFIIPAVSLNAPHRRDRVWIVAHTKHNRELSESRSIQSQNEQETQKRQENRSIEPCDSNTNASNSRRKHGQQRGSKGFKYNTTQRASQTTETQRYSETWNENWLEVATRLCRVDDGLPTRLDRAGRLKGLGNAIVPQVAAEIMRGIKEINEANGVKTQNSFR